MSQFNSSISKQHSVSVGATARSGSARSVGSSTVGEAGDGHRPIGGGAAIGSGRDVNELVGRLLQIRDYQRQALALRRSVDGEQGRNLDQLMRQLAAQEEEYIALLGRLLPDTGDVPQAAVAAPPASIDAAGGAAEGEDDYEEADEETGAAGIAPATAIDESVERELAALRIEQERMRRLLAERRALQADAQEALTSRRQELDDLREQRDRLREMLLRQERLRARQGQAVAVMQGEQAEQRRQLQLMRQRETLRAAAGAQLAGRLAAAAEADEEEDESIRSAPRTLQEDSEADEERETVASAAASSTAAASTDAVEPEARLARRLTDLEAKKARLDAALGELSALRAAGVDASTTSTEQQAFASSLRAGNTAGEAASLLGAMDARAQLEKLRTVRDRLSGIRQLVAYYQEAAEFIHGRGDAATSDGDSQQRGATSAAAFSQPAAPTSATSGRSSTSARQMEDRARRRLLNYGSSLDGDESSERGVASSAAAATAGISKASASSEADSVQWADADPLTQQRARQLRDAKSKLARLQALLEGVSSLGGMEAPADLPEQQLYDLAVLEQSQELRQLMEERERLSELQGQLERLQRRLRDAEAVEASGGTPAAAFASRGGVRVAEIREIGNEDEDDEEEEIDDSDEDDARSAEQVAVGGAGSVTFQEPVATTSLLTNETVYGRMRTEKLLREELRGGRGGVGVDPTSATIASAAATWGGSTSAASNLEDAVDAEEEEEEDEVDDDEDDDDEAEETAAANRRRRHQGRQQESLGNLGSATQVLLCLQQCCSMLATQQQEMTRLSQQVSGLASAAQHPMMTPQMPPPPMQPPPPPPCWFWQQPPSCLHQCQRQQQEQQPVSKTSAGSQTESMPRLDLASLRSPKKLQSHQVQQQQRGRTPPLGRGGVSSGIAGTGPVPYEDDDDDDENDEEEEAEAAVGGSGVAGRSGFESLRESIYSEVAALISQNEARPHYLVELFRELQLLSTDFLRQRALLALQELVNRHLSRQVSAGSNAIGANRRLPPWLRDAGISAAAAEAGAGIEQTPSESYATTTTATSATAAGDDNEDAVRRAAARALARRLAGGGAADYAEPVVYYDASSSVSTTPSARAGAGGGSMFARDSLGDTVVHLDRAMQILRDRRQQQQQQPPPVPPRPQLLDSRRLDAQIKAVVHHLIPLVKAHAHETATLQFLTWLRDLALRRVRLIMAAHQPVGASTTDSDDEFERLFSRQLSNLVTDALARYQGRRLVDCLEDLLVDLSETLFNELAFHRLIANLDEANNRRGEGSSGRRGDVGAAEAGDDDDDEDEEEEEEEDKDDDQGPVEEAELVEDDVSSGLAVQLAASETREMTLIGSEEEEVEGGSMAAADDDSDGNGEDTEGLTAVAAVIDAEEKDAQRPSEKRPAIQQQQQQQQQQQHEAAEPSAAPADLRSELLETLSGPEHAADLIGGSVADADQYEVSSADGKSNNGFVTVTLKNATAEENE